MGWLESGAFRWAGLSRAQTDGQAWVGRIPMGRLESGAYRWAGLSRAHTDGQAWVRRIPMVRPESGTYRWAGLSRAHTDGQAWVERIWMGRPKSGAYRCLNHHRQATNVGCCVARKCLSNSPSYSGDMVLLGPMNCPSDTLGGMSRICWTAWHCITQRKQYVCWSDQRNHRVGTQQQSGSVMRNLAV